MTFLFALVTIASWGSWLIPANSAKCNQQSLIVFFVTLANFSVSLVFALLRWSSGVATLSVPDFFWIVLGGAAWSLSGCFAFAATSRIGTAAAMGLWSPLNILVSLAWGGLLFGEFSKWTERQVVLGTISVGLLVLGVVVIIFASHVEVQHQVQRLSGVLYSTLAGVFWGSYFIPIRWTSTPAEDAMWPMSLGMLVGSSGILLLQRSRGRPILGRDVGLFLVSGLLWSVGNIGSLALMERLGTGRGFAVAQLCLVLNGILGIYVQGVPPPRSRSALILLLGCVVATFGGVMLGCSHTA